MALDIGAFCCLYGLGGAQNSTITLCNALAKRGNKVTLYCPAKQMFSHIKPEIETVDTPINLLDPGHLYNVSNKNKKKIEDEILNRKHDCLLSFTYPSLFMTIPLSLKYKIPLLQYMLGPVYSPILKVHPGSMVVNCEETRDIITEKSGMSKEGISIIRARIDADKLKLNIDLMEAKKKYGNTQGLKQIGMLCPLHDWKKNTFIQGLEAVRLLSRTRNDFRFLLAGDGRLRPLAQELINNINKESGRETARLVGQIGDVGNFLSVCDVALGIGRCAFEAMALGKPTLIVGENGYAGTVCPEQVYDLAYYNFAGRNIKSMNSPDSLFNELNKLLNDEKLRVNLGEYSQEYLANNLLCSIGAEQFEKILTNKCEKTEEGVDKTTSTYFFYLLCCTKWYLTGLLKRAIRPTRAAKELKRIQTTAKHNSQYVVG